MKETLKLLRDNILIKEFKEKEKFGIKSDNLSVKAKVYSIGPDVDNIGTGDIVYLSKYSGIPYGEYRMVKPHEILGVENEG